tara:strand:- start:219 stop:578 length:360 start_codon:yes stop_codon:yes gene_type:complete
MGVMENKQKTENKMNKVRKITRESYYDKNGKHYGHKTSWGEPASPCSCCDENLCEEEVEITCEADCSYCEKGVCSECYQVDLDGHNRCIDCIHKLHYEHNIKNNKNFKLITWWEHEENK